jgi:formamidopyrimidine-DNA glycosylase
MPELPDLAVFSENLQAQLQGRTVHSVECHGANLINTTLEQLRDALCSTSIVSVQRAGKEISFIFSNQATLLVHLMLKGEFVSANDPDTVRFPTLTLGFETESLMVSDPEGLVKLTLNPRRARSLMRLKSIATICERKYRKSPGRGRRHF